MTGISDYWRYFCDVKKQHAKNNIDERAHGLVKKISIDEGMDMDEKLKNLLSECKT